jgi:hypothetical protein
MARNRMLNPEFWLDEELATLSSHARLLYMGLWGICDDNFATFPDRPDWIKAQIFPYEQVNISALLSELESIGKLVRFADDKKGYWWIKNFFKHQRVDKPSKAKYPAHPLGILPDYSESTPAEDKISKENEKEDISFDQFWNSYPKKVEKKKAEDKWNRLSRATQEIILKDLPLRKQTESWKKGYILNPMTYFNGERWNDALVGLPESASPPRKKVCKECKSEDGSLGWFNVPGGQVCGKCFNQPQSNKYTEAKSSFLKQTGI